MSFKLFGVKIKISFLLISLLALFSLFDNDGFILFALTSAFIHELGHVFIAEIVKCYVNELHFTPIGIKMILKTPLSLVNTKRKLAILSAGSGINLLFFIIFLAFQNKNAALIHLVTAVFNLLPAGTLDGGRILLELLSLRYELQKAQKIADAVSLLFSILLFVLGSVVLVYTGYNFSLLLTSVYLASAVILRQKS